MPALLPWAVVGVSGLAVWKAEGTADAIADAAKWSAVAVGVYYGGRYLIRKRKG